MTSLRAALLCFTIAFALGPIPLPGAEIEVPVSADPQLEVTLFAAEPQVVTPIGLAVDRANRIFVVESHTHQPNPDYPGPKRDRVKLFIDQDRDGRPEKVSVFAGGFYHSMNLAISPQNELYLVHRNGVVILHDRDGDGVSEAQTPVVQLETTGVYPHDGLSGIAFSPDGWLYVGMGENLGHPYTLKGRDGSQHRGGGEGGNIFRCRPDGSRLEWVATGFWNPFGLEFDRGGNLFCVDNDPDSRPPCRLLHVIDKGDYGYKFRHGRSGLHPFQAWNGELPGTLPMVAGTGEAPSGILLADRAALPAKYCGCLLVTSWGDHFLELYRPQPRGASFTAGREILLRGGEFFRPVAIAAAPDGVLYLTDWADVSYPVHGKGRIWRLAARRGGAVVKPGVVPSATPVHAALSRLRAIERADSTAQFAGLESALADPDPFLRSAAIGALQRPAYRDQLVGALAHQNPAVRVGALLALRRTGCPNPAALLKTLLTDPNDDVRFAALMWVGEEGLHELSGDIDRAFSSGTVSARIFEAYLATVDLLAQTSPDPTKPPNERAAALARDEAVERIVDDDGKPESLRALAVGMLRDRQRLQLVDQLIHLAEGDHPQLKLAAVRALAGLPPPRPAAILETLALDRKTATELRTEAILALARTPDAQLSHLTPLLADPDPEVELETARALRVAASDPQVQSALARRLQAVERQESRGALAEELRLGLGKITAPNSTDPETALKPWREAATHPGNPDSGRRMFYHPLVACAKCHRIQGQGGTVGPDLSTIARSSDRAKLVQSILQPSAEIAPQFEQHLVETRDGQSYSGVWVNVRLDGTLILNTAGAGQVSILGANIERHQTSKLSLMPEGLEQTMTPPDFRDLIAFLESLK